MVLYRGLLSAHVEAQVELSEFEFELLYACKKKSLRTSELLKAMGYTTRTGNFKAAIRNSIAKGFLAMTMPENPQNPLQRLRLTAQGRLALKNKKRRRRV